MKRIMLISVVSAVLGLSSLALAQDSAPTTEPAPNDTTSPTTEPQAVAPVGAPAEEVASPPQATPAAEVPLPAADAAQPETKTRARAYEAPPRRYVLLRPVARPIRRREPRRYGNAGAPFSFGIGASLLWPSDRGYRVAGVEDTQGHFEMFASYDVFQPHERVVIAAGASFRTLGGADEEDVDLSLRTVQADLTARVQVLSWLWPHLRGSLGAAFSKLTIDDVVDPGDRSDVIYKGSDQSLVGTVGVGFTLKTPARTFETYRGRLSSLSFGVMVEGGYLLGQRAELNAEPDATRNIATSSASLGSLDLTAPYLRLAAVTRF